MRREDIVNNQSTFQPRGQIPAMTLVHYTAVGWYKLTQNSNLAQRLKIHVSVATNSKIEIFKGPLFQIKYCSNKEPPIVRQFAEQFSRLHDPISQGIPPPTKAASLNDIQNSCYSLISATKTKICRQYNVYCIVDNTMNVLQQVVKFTNKINF